MEIEEEYQFGDGSKEFWLLELDELYPEMGEAEEVLEEAKYFLEERVDE